MTLGLRPVLQQKVYEEIQTITDKSTGITMADLHALKYLECFIKETFRMFPLDTLIGRYAAEDIQLSK